MTPHCVLDWIDQFSDFYWIPAIVIGYLFCFSGYKVFVPATCIAWCLTGAALGLVFAPTSGQVLNGTWIDVVGCGLLGLVFSVLVLLFYLLALICLGAVLGALSALVAMIWLMEAGHPILPDHVALACLVGAVVGAFLILEFAGPLLVIGTAWSGAFGLIAGILQGVVFLEIAPRADVYSLFNDTSVGFVACLVLTICGAVVQYQQSRKKD